MRVFRGIYMTLAAITLALPILVVCAAALNSGRSMFFPPREPTLARFGEFFVSEPIWTNALMNSVIVAFGAARFGRFDGVADCLSFVVYGIKTVQNIGRSGIPALCGSANCIRCRIGVFLDIHSRIRGNLGRYHQPCDPSSGFAHRHHIHRIAIN